MTNTGHPIDDLPDLFFDRHESWDSVHVLPSFYYNSYHFVNVRIWYWLVTLSKFELWFGLQSLARQTFASILMKTEAIV